MKSLCNAGKLLLLLLLAPAIAIQPSSHPAHALFSCGAIYNGAEVPKKKWDCVFCNAVSTAAHQAVTVVCMSSKLALLSLFC